MDWDNEYNTLRMKNLNKDTKDIYKDLDFKELSSIFMKYQSELVTQERNKFLEEAQLGETKDKMRLIDIELSLMKRRLED